MGIDNKGEIIDIGVSFGQYVTDLQLLNWQLAKSYQSLQLAEDSFSDTNSRECTRKTLIADNLSLEERESFCNMTLGDRITKLAAEAKGVLRCRRGFEYFVSRFGEHVRVIFSNRGREASNIFEMIEDNKATITALGTEEDINSDRDEALRLIRMRNSNLKRLIDLRTEMAARYPEYADLLPDSVKISGQSYKDPDSVKEESAVDLMPGSTKRMSRALSNKVKGITQARGQCGKFTKVV